jgi:hypothetical protein
VSISKRDGRIRLRDSFTLQHGTSNIQAPLELVKETYGYMWASNIQACRDREVIYKGDKVAFRSVDIIYPVICMYYNANR